MIQSSKEIKRGIQWLDQLSTEKLLEAHHAPEDLPAFLEAFYALYKIYGSSHSLISEFNKLVKEDNFWKSTSFWDSPYLLYYLSKMGFFSHHRFLILVGGLIKQNQNFDGYIKTNEYDHTGPMRILILQEPQSRITKKAVDFFVSNKEVFIDRSDNSAGFYYDTIPMGLIALHELDDNTHTSTINTLVKVIKIRTAKEGYIKFRDLPHKKFQEYIIKNTALTVLAFTKIFGSMDEYVQKASKWLQSQQLSNGSWNNSILDTAKVIRALAAIL